VPTLPSALSATLVTLMEGLPDRAIERMPADACAVLEVTVPPDLTQSPLFPSVPSKLKTRVSSDWVRRCSALSALSSGVSRLEQASMPSIIAHVPTAARWSGVCIYPSRVCRSGCMMSAPKMSLPIHYIACARL